MAIFKELFQRAEDAFIRHRAEAMDVEVVNKLTQTFLDIDLIESPQEMREITPQAFFARVGELQKEMGDMRSNELQEFVNSKIEPIEDENRRKQARKFLQEDIKGFVSKKTE